MKHTLSATLAHALMCALVALYGSFILVLALCRTMQPALFMLLSVALFALLILLSRRTSILGIDAPAQADPFPWRMFALAAGLCMLTLLIYLVGYFPGGFSSDTLSQWKQIHEVRFDDWHPALHTLFLWALTRIVDHPAFCVLVQMLCYALCVGYAVAVLRRWRLPKLLCLLTAAYLSLSPALCNLMSFLWKDCAFAISTLALAAFLLEIHLSQGAWLKSPVRLCALAIALCMTSILRHNGCAMTLPAIVWLLVSFPKRFKRIACTALCAASLLVFIKGPVYDRAHVTERKSGLGEIFGVPMVVLSHVYAQSPDALSDQAVAFMDRFGDHEAFKTYDVPGDWNATKWHVASPDLADYSLLDVSRFALEAAQAEPQLALEAISGLAKMPLLPFSQAYWRMSPYVDAGAAYLGVERTGVSFLSRVLNALCRISATRAFSWLFWNPGFPLLVLMLACALLQRRRPLSALLLPAMLICYHLVTTVVLSSPTDFRFFLSTPMIVPLSLAGLILKPQSRQEDA